MLRIATISTWLCFACAGCGGSESSPGTGTGGGVATGGAAGESNSGGASTAGGAVAVGGSGGSSAGGTSTTGGSSGFGGTGVATPTPPTWCYPPCMWSLVSGCRAAGECTIEARGAEYISCEATTDWRVVRNTETFETQVFGQDGSICYYIFEGDPTQYFDAEQQTVASITDSQTPGVRTALCYDDAVLYDFDLGLPECQPYLAQICQPGTCP